MYQLVIGALQKSRIDGHNRLQTVAGHSRGDSQGVLLGDPDVKETQWKAPGEFHQPRSLPHRRGYRDDPLIALSAIDERLREHLRVCGTGRVFLDRHTGARIEGSGPMPGDRISFSRAL